MHVRHGIRALVLGGVLAALSATAACTPLGQTDAAATASAPTGSAATGPGSTPAAPAPTSADTATGADNCAVPHCRVFLSRGTTRTLDAEVSAHPIASIIGAHIILDAACTVVGGGLAGLACVLGSGVAAVDVENAAHTAARENACVRITLLPQGREWQVVAIAPSNEEPDCTD